MIADAIPIIVAVALSLWTAFGNRWVYRVSSGRGLPTGSPKGCAFTLLWLLVFLLAPLVLVLISAEKFVSEPSTRISIFSIFTWLVPWSLHGTALRYATAPELAGLSTENRRNSQRLVVFGGLALVLICLCSGLASIFVAALVTGHFLDMDAPTTSGNFAVLLFVLVSAVVIGPMLGMLMWSTAARKLLPRDVIEIVRARSGLRKST